MTVHFDPINFDAATGYGAGDAAAWALHYIERGWAPLPVPYRSKAPKLDDWPSLRITKATVQDYFNGAPMNVGVILGEASAGLMDVDLDATEAVSLGTVFLPATPCRFGRPGKQQSHWLYVGSPLVKTEKFKDVDADQTMLVELRGTGAQTVFPGSVHVSGEPIMFTEEGEPTVMAGSALRQQVVYLAAAALLARHWPKGKSNRHDICLAAAGFLLRAGLNVDVVEAIIVGAAGVAGDEEARERGGRNVTDTAAKLAAGQEVTGGTRLGEFLDPTVVTRMRLWGLTDGSRSQAGDDPRPACSAKVSDLKVDAARLWAVVEQCNTTPSLFRTAVLSWVEQDDAGVPFIRQLNPARLAHWLGQQVYFFTQVDGKPRSALPPSALVQDLLVTPDPPVPILSQIVGTPVYAADGTLHATPGYDAATRAWYAPAPGFSVPPVPRTPTRGEVRTAATAVAEVFADFPFVGPADRAHVVGALLSLFARNLIAGPCPFVLFTKPAPGTGATLCAKAIVLLATGHAPAVMTQAATEEEWGKKLFALLLQGPAVMFLDNLRGVIESAELSAVLTSDTYGGRVLGRSEILRVPVRTVWLGTANNATFSTELVRRTVRAKFDAGVERPWLREQEGRIIFRHPDLPGWITAERPRLVQACLTLVAAWLAAGRPAGATTMGSYEDWARVVGGILAVAGFPGFLSNLEDLYAEQDTETDEAKRFLSAWWEQFREAAQTVKDLLATATSESVDLPLGGKDDRGRRIALGRWLHKQQGRHYDLPGVTVTVVRHPGDRDPRWKLRGGL